MRTFKKAAVGYYWRLEPTLADIERAVATAAALLGDSAEFRVVARALLLMLDDAQTSTD